MRIYVDTTTGTWGESKDLVIRDATQDEVDALDGTADSTIIHFGLTGKVDYSKIGT